jgi:two-component system chemotaxis response regulator CheB
MGIILTGMGSDGVEGLGAIKTSGGNTIAESEETCILYAMPKFASEKGFANLVLPNYDIQQEIIEFSKH